MAPNQYLKMALEIEMHVATTKTYHAKTFISKYFSSSSDFTSPPKKKSHEMSRGKNSEM